MPALLLRLLLKCAGDIEMNPRPVSTQTPTNCLRLRQWNKNWISCENIELLTFLHNNNVNNATLLSKKQSWPTRLSRWKRKDWQMFDLTATKTKASACKCQSKTKIVDNTAALPQSADPHLELKGISITMPNRQQLHIYIPSHSSCSAGHNASTAHLLCNNKMSLIAGNINAHPSRWDTKTKEANT